MLSSRSTRTDRTGRQLDGDESTEEDGFRRLDDSFLLQSDDRRSDTHSGQKTLPKYLWVWQPLYETHFHRQHRRPFATTCETRLQRVVLVGARRWRWSRLRPNNLQPLET